MNVKRRLPLAPVLKVTVHLSAEYFLKQLDEAWIRAKRVEGGIDLEVDQPVRPFLVRLFQPVKRRLFIAHPEMHQNLVVRRNETLLLSRIQLVDGCLRLGTVARSSVDVAERGHRVAIVRQLP